jgi:hypothetical protein
MAPYMVALKGKEKVREIGTAVLISRTLFLQPAVV